MRVFVTGATGLVGRALVPALLAAGHEVVALSRSQGQRGFPPGVTAVQGDPALAGAWQEALAGCDGCVHLAGEPVAAGRWTDERKRRIRDSRVEGTRHVAEAVGSRGPAVLVSGSAVGFYGDRGDELLDERSPAGVGFLAEVCQAWEAAALAASPRARVVLLRTGIVLSKVGGALAQMLLPFKLFVGGPVGSGRQWQPWVHLADVVGLARWALETTAVEGPLDVTAPAPVQNRDLAAAIGRALRRPSALPVPALALRLLLGELSTVVTSGQRALPRKAQELGYRFRFPELGPALEDVLKTGR